MYMKPNSRFLFYTSTARTCYIGGINNSEWQEDYTLRGFVVHPVHSSEEQGGREEKKEGEVISVSFFFFFFAHAYIASYIYT